MGFLRTSDFLHYKFSALLAKHQAEHATRTCERGVQCSWHIGCFLQFTEYITLQQGISLLKTIYPDRNNNNSDGKHLKDYENEFRSCFYTGFWCDLKNTYSISVNVTFEQRQEQEEQPPFLTLQCTDILQPTPRWIKQLPGDMCGSWAGHRAKLQHLCFTVKKAFP